MYGSSHEIIIQLQLISNTIWKSYIIINSTNSIEVYIIRRIFCNYFFIICKKVFPVFQQPLLIILSILTSMHFALLLEAARQLWGEKLTILFTMKIYLIHLLNVSMEAPLNGFLRVIRSWSVVNPSCLLWLEIY